MAFFDSSLPPWLSVTPQDNVRTYLSAFQASAEAGARNRELAVREKLMREEQSRMAEIRMQEMADQKRFTELTQKLSGVGDDVVQAQAILAQYLDLADRPSTRMGMQMIGQRLDSLRTQKVDQMAKFAMGQAQAEMDALPANDFAGRINVLQKFGAIIGQTQAGRDFLNETRANFKTLMDQDEAVKKDKERADKLTKSQELIGAPWSPDETSRTVYIEGVGSVTKSNPAKKDDGSTAMRKEILADKLMRRRAAEKDWRDAQSTEQKEAARRHYESLTREIEEMDGGGTPKPAGGNTGDVTMDYDPKLKRLVPLK